jgi:hypothetical protein
MSDRTAAVYLVAPDSLRSWFASFAALGPHDDVVFTGEGHQLPPALLPELGPPGDRVVVFLSGHATLARDNAAADQLRRRGYRVIAQSARCAALGADKVAMKAFFDQCGLRSPAWASAGDPRRTDLPEGLLVVKSRWGTQSVGIRLASRADGRPAPDEYCEAYLDGVEYSVVVYRDEHGLAVFPPIWKGPTSPTLVPPWRRLRLCPFPGLTAGVEGLLRRTGRRIAEAVDCVGLMDIDCVLGDDGTVDVLEINPRVAGTLRISAMATGVPVFAMHKRPDLRGDLAAVRHAAEVPFSGEPYIDPENNIFASSRLTVAASSPMRLWERLRQVDEPAARHLALIQNSATPSAVGP